MAKGRREKNGRAAERNPRFFELHPEIKKSVLAVLFLGTALVLTLASFGKAGPAGSFIYRTFDRLFGLGYYLFPLIFLILSIVFIASQKRKILYSALLGALFFILSGLGLIDIISPQKGGLVGAAIGFIEVPFGFPASIVLSGTFIFASLLVTLNIPLKLPSRKAASTEEDEDNEKLTTNEIAAIAASEESEIKKTDKTKNNKENQKEESKKTQKESEGIIIASPAKKEFLKNTELIKVRNYVSPPLELLKSSHERASAGDLRANANIIKRTLDGFGIPVEMGEITIGPTVTRYTLKPAEGVKLSRIIALNQDLALALAAHPIRIEAPIPGKSFVGVEVPNKSAAIVRLGNLMAYPEFSSSSPTTFIVGRDVSGEPHFADISKMPHLLIAGTTGSGKSVTIHSLIISLLYRNSPETLRLILIDPKRVELTTYADIPHLIAPVITEGKKAIGALRWAISEMDRRYDVLMAAGARDIKSYNGSGKNDKLHYIVIVIDEMADLMSVYGREVESAIVRLAQMARATGIHLVLSTQRPSVQVITGLIKANIPTRIALQVPSQVDSRTILDTSGAEKLLGAGDMLFTSAEFSKPKRIQGTYVTEEEVHKVVAFIKEHNQEEAILESLDVKKEEEPVQDAGMFDNFSNEDDDDELYLEALRVVHEAKKASASLLQRRLKVGYARAARLLDMMEAKGIIGKGDGAKPREVFEGDASVEMPEA